MKPSRSSSPVFQVALLSCLSAVGFAQAQQQPVNPQYASTYYPPPRPSVAERIRSAGQNVGDFVRRKFYGEGAPVSYQQPAYQTPGGYQTQRYNLDAPAGAAAGGSTGFQEPTRSTTPKYVTPPRDEPDEQPKSVAAPKKTETKPVSTKTTKSSPPTTRSKEPEPATAATTASRKRYTPAKPSSFASSSTTKTTTVKKRIEEESPTTRTVPSETVHYDAPVKEPSFEAKPKTESTPPAPVETASNGSTGISPTIGGTDVDLTPKFPASEPMSLTKTEAPTISGSNKEPEPKPGSFPTGKKGSKPGRVVSPYAPYNELDITGLPSGSLALDPTTQKVFQVP